MFTTEAVSAEVNGSEKKRFCTEKRAASQPVFFCRFETNYSFCKTFVLALFNLKLISKTWKKLCGDQVLSRTCYVPTTLLT